MGFRSNKLAFQELKNPTEKLPDFDRILELMQRRSTPKESDIKDLEVKGWSPGRGILLPLTMENSLVDGSLLFVQLVSCERKVPASLLAEHIKAEEMLRLKSTGREFLSRKERAEIRDEVLEVLAPQQPVSYSSSEVVITQGGRVFTDATSDAKLDAVRHYLKDATGVLLEPMTPEVRALLNLPEQKFQSLGNVTFSPEKHASVTLDGLGPNCLTSWLWASDTEQKSTQGGSLVFDGDLTLESEEGGAQKVVLQKGSPAASRELKESLLAGKKITKASLMVSSASGQVSNFVITAKDFKVSAFKPVLSDADQELSADQKFATNITAAEGLSDSLTAWLLMYVAWAGNEKIRAEWPKWTEGRKVL